MTDENIMKALDHCLHDVHTECPYENERNCVNTMLKDVRDLIHRQKDEIEGLLTAQETLQKHIAQLNKELERANATGIKEYEKRLLNKMFPYNVTDKKEYSINAYAVYKAITDISKELVDDTK